MSRVAIIGDVGGHAEELYSELVRLGADVETLRLPDDLTVVQVGDLVHRGPDSAGALALVEGALIDQPDQWVQLSGNHEGQYVHDPAFVWPQRLAEDDQDRLRRWWSDGRMRVAAAVRAGDEQMLVTHAGLTSFVWDTLGAPADVESAAAAVNALIPDHPQLTRAGAMLGGRTTLMAGPWWAEAGSELYASWGLHVGEGHDLPFSQAHGHSSVFTYGAGQFKKSFPARLRGHVKVNDVDRHVTLTLPGGRIVGVDPDHGVVPARRWRPLVLENATVTAR